jgi:hypothetical protein
MLEGDRIAPVSSGAASQTFANERYVKDIMGTSINVYDTAGFNESTDSTVARTRATVNLYKLLRQLEGTGVNLLVYVMRAPRITATAQKNYRLFYEAFCDKKVPIVIIVTGLEAEHHMDQWWYQNKDEFESRNMEFAGWACITADRGKLTRNGYKNEDEYNESRLKVQDLIAEHCSGEPWKMDSAHWFKKVLLWLIKWVSYWPFITTPALYNALKENADISDAEARRVSNQCEAIAIGVAEEDQ